MATGQRNVDPDDSHGDIDGARTHNSCYCLEVAEAAALPGKAPLRNHSAGAGGKVKEGRGTRHSLCRRPSFRTMTHGPRAADGGQGENTRGQTNHRRQPRAACPPLTRTHETRRQRGRVGGWAGGHENRRKKNSQATHNLTHRHKNTVNNWRESCLRHRRREFITISQGILILLY